MDFKEVGWRDVHWISLPLKWESLAGCCEYGDELLGFKICGEFLDCLRNIMTLTYTGYSKH
jgi:hypothetical protein